MAGSKQKKEGAKFEYVLAVIAVLMDVFHFKSRLEISRDVFGPRCALNWHLEPFWS